MCVASMSDPEFDRLVKLYLEKGMSKGLARRTASRKIKNKARRKSKQNSTGQVK